jgi:predicted enzyme related to lactoylglutathione lyase
MPDSIPPHWLVYFAVDDTDASIEKAKELGGNIAAGPIEIPFGKFAVMTDPNGSAFAVMQLAQRG